MRPSFALLAAAVLESLAFVAGLSPWAKLSAYLKSSDRPFVLTRVFPNQAEFKCVCDGTDNKYFKEITWKDNRKTINDILPNFDKRFEKCNEFAESLTKNIARKNQLLADLKIEIDQKLFRCLYPLFSVACCSTPNKVLKSNEDFYKLIDGGSIRSSQYNAFFVHCQYPDEPIKYPNDCPDEKDQIF